VDEAVGGKVFVEQEPIPRFGCGALIVGAATAGHSMRGKLVTYTAEWAQSDQGSPQSGSRPGGASTAIESKMGVSVASLGLRKLA
jgi:hypothetical protein